MNKDRGLTDIRREMLRIQITIDARGGIPTPAEQAMLNTLRNEALSLVGVDRVPAC